MFPTKKKKKRPYKNVKLCSHFVKHDGSSSNSQHRRIHSPKTEMDSNKYLYIHVHVSKKWKQPKYPSADEQIDMLYIYTVHNLRPLKSFFFLKKNDFLKYIANTHMLEYLGEDKQK